MSGLGHLTQEEIEDRIAQCERVLSALRKEYESRFTHANRGICDVIRDAMSNGEAWSSHQLKEYASTSLRRHVNPRAISTSMYWLKSRGEVERIRVGKYRMVNGG